MLALVVSMIVVAATVVVLRKAPATRQRLRHLRATYRPELHYMRGPGPKWREKHVDADRS